MVSAHPPDPKAAEPRSDGRGDVAKVAPGPQSTPASVPGKPARTAYRPSEDALLEAELLAETKDGEAMSDRPPPPADARGEPTKPEV